MKKGKDASPAFCILDIAFLFSNANRLISVILNEL